MIPENKYTIEEYKEAFVQFTDASENEFQLKMEDGALALYEGETYRIVSYDDLLNVFKTYFNDDYSLIYTETPFVLWEILFEAHHEITDEDLIIDIFNAWSIYWEGQRETFSSTKRFNDFKAQSREEFNQLIKGLQEKPGDFVKNAIELSDTDLIPVIALALRGRFKTEEDFYKECVDILIEQLPHLFSNDGNFDEVKVLCADSVVRPFYIYQPDYDFEDY